MLRLAFAALALVALPLVALADTSPGNGKPVTKPAPRPSGAYPNGNHGAYQPQVYIDASSFVTPRPKTSPQHHTNTVKTSMPQETFHSYGTGN